MFEFLKNSIVTNITNKKGFSLTEVIVTIAILGIIISPMLSTFYLAQENSSLSFDITKVTTIAQQKMEELKSMSLNDLENLHNICFLNNNEIKEIEAAELSNSQYRISYSVYKESEDTISWSSELDNITPPYQLNFSETTINQELTIDNSTGIFNNFIDNNSYLNISCSKSENTNDKLTLILNYNDGWENQNINIYLENFDISEITIKNYSIKNTVNVFSNYKNQLTSPSIKLSLFKITVKAYILEPEFYDNETSTFKPICTLTSSVKLGR